MTTIVFFISGHGFGHASREVEIMNALGARLGAGLRLIIRSAVSPALLERTVKVPYELRPGICDTGIVQSNSVTHDDDATTEAASAFYAQFDARVAEEVAALRYDAPTAIVCDASPLGLAVAHALGVPSIFIGNFTWDWIYETHGDLPVRAPHVIPTIRRAHGMATAALRLPLAPSFEGTGLPPATDIPLVARQPSRSRRDTREALGLPQGRALALLSFGGYGLNALDLATIDCAARWDLVVADQSMNDPRLRALPYVHVVRERDLGDAVRYEDLVAAVDVVVTKPGFGIIGECATAGTPMVYTSRGDFREYDVLVREMPRVLRCTFITQADLFAGRWQAALDAAVALPAPPERWPPDGARMAADRIAALAQR